MSLASEPSVPELRSLLVMHANDPLTSAQIALVLAENAQRNLLDFCQFVTPWFETPRHIEFLAPYYEKVERGEIDRLMVLMPPRHGKTHLGLHFLAWYLARHPREEIVLASYNDTIAGHFGGKVRGLISRPEYAQLCEEGFGAMLDPLLKGRELFQTTAGGVFRAAGLNAGTSGFGGNGLFVDDFVKGRQEADSPTTRSNTSNTYSAELYPRIMPIERDGKKLPGWVIMQYTPWHEQDLGQSEVAAMNEGIGDDWTIVRLPAIAEAGDHLGRKVGEALWPERYSLETLNRIKAVLDRKNPRDWPALYQCRPAALEGTFYKLSMLPDLDRNKVGRVSHLIVTDMGAGGDETAHGIVAVDSTTDCAFVDVWHKRCDALESAEAFLDLLAKYRAIGGGVTGWVHAKGVLDKGTRPLFALRATQRNIPLPPEFDYNESGDKLSLSGSIQGYCLAGRVRFDHSADWWPWLRDQCLAFTGAEGAADEGPDLLKMLGLHLDKVVAPPKVALRQVIAPQWGLGR